MIRVYYLREGTTEIHSLIVDREMDHGCERAFLSDTGHWMYAKDCYITEEQCKIAHGLIPNFQPADMLLDRLEHLKESMKEAVEWIDALNRHIELRKSQSGKRK